MKIYRTYPINLVKALYAYHHGKTKLASYPLIREIEPTNACNFRCSFCVRGQIEKRGIGYMSLETLRNIVKPEYAPMLRHVQVFMHGEPTLHPKLAEFVAVLRPYVKTVGFTTNGQLLTEKKGRELLESGIDKICFSFEGINKEVYEKLRVGGSYSTVKHNILTLLRLRKVLNKTVRISIAIIDCPETHEGLNDFLRFWVRVVDKVRVLPIHNWGGTHTGIKESLRNRFGACLYPWIGFGVYWNGDVAPCCMYESSDMGLGNVNEQSPMEIWNSPEYQQFRHDMLYDRDKLPLCRTCQINGFTDEYLRTVENPNKYFPATKGFANLLRDFAVKWTKR